MAVQHPHTHVVKCMHLVRGEGVGQGAESCACSFV